MKKVIFVGWALLSGTLVFAADPQPKASAANTESPVKTVQTAKQPQESSLQKMTPAEQKKSFENRRKLIKQLVKKYRKAPEAQKPAIKAQLTEVVSESVDAGFAYIKDRIAAERANLDNWEAKIQEDEKNIDQIKARRVEDLLSGEAKRKHEAAQKKWKKQMKKAKKQMR